MGGSELSTTYCQTGCSMCSAWEARSSASSAARAFTAACELWVSPLYSCGLSTVCPKSDLYALDAGVHVDRPLDALLLAGIHVAPVVACVSHALEHAEAHVAGEIRLRDHRYSAPAGSLYIERTGPEGRVLVHRSAFKGAQVVGGRPMTLFSAGVAVALPRCVISVEWLKRKCANMGAVHDALIPGTLWACHGARLGETLLCGKLHYDI